MSKLNHFITRLALTFSVAVVFSACFNLVNGNSAGDYAFILELLGLALGLGLIDTLSGRIEFHSRLAYICFELLLMYSVFLAFAYLGSWFGFTFVNILLFSAVFLLFYLLLHLYDYAVLRAKAKEINSGLNKRN